MSKEKVSNKRISPEFVLLGFLYKTPSHGYDLHRRLVDEFGYIWHVSQPQTYNILKRLHAQGYITSKTITQEKLPARQILQLSELGLKRFVSWLETPTKCSVHAVRVEFITRLYFIQQYYPNKIQETIRNQVEEVNDGFKRLEAIRKGLPADQTFNRLALDMRLKLLDSIIGWLIGCCEEFATITI